MYTGVIIYPHRVIRWQPQDLRLVLFESGGFSLNFFLNLYFMLKLIHNVVLASGVQQRDSVIHIHVPIVFQVLLPFRLFHNIGGEGNGPPLQYSCLENPMDGGA